MTHLPGTDSITFCFKAFVQSIITHPHHKTTEPIKKAIDQYNNSHSKEVSAHKYEYIGIGSRRFSKKQDVEVTHKKSNEAWKGDSESLSLSKNKILEIINSVAELESTTDGLLKSQSDLQIQLTEQRQKSSDLELKLHAANELAAEQAARLQRLTNMQNEDNIRISQRLSVINKENESIKQSDEDLWKVVNALVTKHTSSSNV